jgi:hypothetical protein
MKTTYRALDMSNRWSRTSDIPLGAQDLWRGLPMTKDRNPRALRTAEMRARRAQLEAELGAATGTSREALRRDLRGSAVALRTL